MRNQLFQEQALERLSSPEQLDRLMPLTSRRGWLALAAIGLLLVAGVVWSLLGTVETTIKAEGMMTSPGPLVAVGAPKSGTLKWIAQPGDPVEQETLLGLVDFAQVRSPAKGRVLEWDALPGSEVKQGVPLVSIETSGDKLEVVAFVSAAEGYRVQPDMKVNVKPASDDPQSSSHIPGIVKRVSRTPTTQAAIVRLLHNESWATTTLADGPVLQVNIEVPGLKPSERIFSGLPCTAQIVVERQRPIELVLPGFSQE